jgi:hypothetical protein
VAPRIETGNEVIQRESVMAQSQAQSATLVISGYTESQTQTQTGHHMDQSQRTQIAVTHNPVTQSQMSHVAATQNLNMDQRYQPPPMTHVAAAQNLDTDPSVLTHAASQVVAAQNYFRITDYLSPTYTVAAQNLVNLDRTNTSNTVGSKTWNYSGNSGNSETIAAQNIVGNYLDHDYY